MQREVAAGLDDLVRAERAKHQNDDPQIRRRWFYSPGSSPIDYENEYRAGLTMGLAA